MAAGECLDVIRRRAVWRSFTVEGAASQSAKTAMISRRWSTESLVRRFFQEAHSSGSFLQATYRSATPQFRGAAAAAGAAPPATDLALPGPGKAVQYGAAAHSRTGGARSGRTTQPGRRRMSPPPPPQVSSSDSSSNSDSCSSSPSSPSSLMSLSSTHRCSWSLNTHGPITLA